MATSVASSDEQKTGKDWDGVPEDLANNLKQCGFASAQKVATSMKPYSEPVIWFEQQKKLRPKLSDLTPDDINDAWLHFHPSKEDGQGKKQTKKNNKKMKKKKGVRRQKQEEGMAHRSLHVLLWNMNTSRMQTVPLPENQQLELKNAIDGEDTPSSAHVSSSSVTQGRTKSKFALVLGVKTVPAGVPILEETRPDGSRQFVFVRYLNKTDVVVPAVSWTKEEVEEEKEQATDPVKETVASDLDERLAEIEKQLKTTKIEKEVERLTEDRNHYEDMRRYMHSGEATAWITEKVVQLALPLIYSSR